MREATRWVAVLVVTWGMIATSTRAATIRGQVVAADGSPAVGAKVRAVPFNQTEDVERPEVIADAAGQFAIGAKPGQWLIAATLGDQGAANDVYAQVQSEEVDPDPVQVRLKPQSRLRGRLFAAETGRAIAGGRFFLDNGLAPVSDADGRFEVSGLHRATHHEGIVVAPGRERFRVLFDLAERPVTDLEVAVPRGARAVGLVVDPDGQPIPRATVSRPFWGSRAIPLLQSWTHTDPKGRFEFDGLRPGRMTWLNATADGFQMSQRNNIRPGPRGEPTALLFRLTPIPAPPEIASAPPPPPAVAATRDVAGVATDPDGKPVADVSVRWGFYRPETKTDAAGRFQFPPMQDQPPGQLWVISLVPPGVDLAPTVVPLEPGNNLAIRVQLPRGRTASGVVRDDAGTPLPHVLVTPLMAKANEWSVLLPERKTATDAQGRFTLRGLPDTVLQANLNTNEEAWDVNSHPLILDGENPITMMATGVIRGRVVDQAGQPVRTFRVLVTPPRDRKPDELVSNIDNGVANLGLTFTAADGSFAIGNLTAGTAQRLTVLADGRGAASIDRVLAVPHYRSTPEPWPTFRLGPTRSLTVHVATLDSRAPIAGARVSLIHDGLMVDPIPDWAYADSMLSDSVHADTDEAGAAAFSALIFTEGTVLVQVPGYPKRHVGWRAGEHDLEVLLEPEAVLMGKLLDRTTDQPLDGLFVQLSSPNAGNQSVALEDDSIGRFRFNDLREGTYTMTVVKQNIGAIHQETITMKPGERKQMTLRLNASKPEEETQFAPIR